MWRKLLLVVAPVLILPLAGVVVGAQIGGGFCPIPHPFLFECTDYELAGAVVGLVVGILAGVGVAVVLTRSWPRSHEADTGAP